VAPWSHLSNRPNRVLDPSSTLHPPHVPPCATTSHAFVCLRPSTRTFSPITRPFPYKLNSSRFQKVSSVSRTTQRGQTVVFSPSLATFILDQILRPLELRPRFPISRHSFLFLASHYPFYLPLCRRLSQGTSSRSSGFSSPLQVVACQAS